MFVFLCFTLPPLVHIALQPAVYFLFLILSINVISCFSTFLVTSFRILSLLDLPSTTILRSQLISATTTLLSSSFLRHQHSDQHIITGMTNNTNIVSHWLLL